MFELFLIIKLYTFDVSFNKSLIMHYIKLLLHLLISLFSKIYLNVNFNKTLQLIIQWSIILLINLAPSFNL